LNIWPVETRRVCGPRWSDFQKDTAYSCRFPIAGVERVGGEPMTGEISSNRSERVPKLHVPVVDDEALIRWSMSETLAQTDHEVTEAADARETLQYLSAGRSPDVILLGLPPSRFERLSLLQTVRRVAPIAGD
jgi:PleD family two-component response regulator